MRLLSLFVDFALNPLEGKQVWDLGALLPAIASLSQGLPAPHAIGKKKTHSNSFDILQVIQEDDANRIKVSETLHVWHPVCKVTCAVCAEAELCRLYAEADPQWKLPDHFGDRLACYVNISGAIIC
jgi:hypothetical protein